MRSADLLVAGRRRAGLSQEQLAARLGRTQSTIARWESGYQHPPLESVVEALHACGLELTVGMARYDDSYESLIARQLTDGAGRSRDALARRTAGFDPIGMLCELAKDAQFVVIGKVAGAFNGWPIMLGTRTLQVVPADSSVEAVEEVARRLGAEPAGEGEDQRAPLGAYLRRGAARERGASRHGWLPRPRAGRSERPDRSGGVGAGRFADRSDSYRRGFDRA